MTESLNIIGSGHVGTALGLLFRRGGWRINDVLARSADSANRAVACLGAGRATTDLATLTPADITVISTPDDAIAAMAARLAEDLPDHPGALWFHCSGATSAEILAPLRARGGTVASLHPLKTFTVPQADAESFDGTFCALDGDSAACNRLRALFEGFGASCAEIDSQAKLVYHAGAVFISNYLHTLVDAGLRCFETAGIDRDQAARALQPLLDATQRNALGMGPDAALTGPIARGDAQLVRLQLAALRAITATAGSDKKLSPGSGDDWSSAPELADLYAVLGRATVRLSAAKGVASQSALDEISTALRDSD